MSYGGRDKHKIALFENKQDKLTAGDNIALTPQQDGTVRIDAEGGGVDLLADLSDVALSTPSNGEVLKYNSSTDKWENGEVGGNVDDVMVNGISVVDLNKVAQVKAHKEITQAEYDALPASKLTDGILYCIKDSAVVLPAFLYGTTTPTASEGVTGNIYIKTDSNLTSIDNVYFNINGTWIPMITDGDVVRY